MGNELIILHSTPLKELTDIFGQIVRNELKNFKPEAPQQTSGEYLSRREVCELLRISLSTLHYYSKDGILQGYRIGGRVLYKAEEVEAALSEMANRKTSAQ